MKAYLLAGLLIVLIISCQEKNRESPLPQIINQEKIAPGPIIHDTLSAEQLEEIRFIQKTFEEILSISLEETITNFKRDQNPDKEISLWLNMAKAYEIFVSKNTGIERIKARQEAFVLLLMCSMMPEEEAIKKSDLEILTDAEIHDILRNYVLEGKPVEIEIR